MAAPVSVYAEHLALRILDGEDVGKIPVTRGDFTRPVFDWRQLQRFAANESGLPGVDHHGVLVRVGQPAAGPVRRATSSCCCATRNTGAELAHQNGAPALRIVCTHAAAPWSSTAPHGLAVGQPDRQDQELAAPRVNGLGVGDAHAHRMLCAGSLFSRGDSRDIAILDGLGRSARE
jgi:hypothetical protein